MVNVLRTSKNIKEHQRTSKIIKDQNINLKKSPTIKLNDTSTASNVLSHKQLLNGGQLSFQ